MRFDATLFLLLALAVFATPRRDAPPERLDFARAGFSIELPEEWDGTVQSDEARLPASATYRLRNAAPGALDGASVTIVRRANLNPLQRQQFMRGRAPMDLGALRPVEALAADAMPFEHGVGVRAEGGGRAALVYFTSSGATYFAVVAEAPANRFDAARPALAAIVRSIRFAGANG